MSDLAEQILRLDAVGDFAGIYDLVLHNARDSGELVFVVYQLLLRTSFRGAYATAKALRARGDLNPVVALAQGLGGALFGDASDEADGLAALTAAIDGLPAEKQMIIYKDVIEKAIPQLVYHFFTNDDPGKLTQLIQILRAAIPQFRDIFDLSAPVEPLDIEEMRRKGRARAKLITLPAPPGDTPKQTRRVVVAAREYFLLVHTGSRPCDMGPRIATAMNTYGWSARYYGMQFQNPMQDYRDIANVCREQNAEILILDDNVIQMEFVRPWRAEMIAQLRRDLPSLKIVSVYFDPWMLKSIDLIDATASVDLVWTPFPSMPIWDHPEFVDKVLLAQMPLGVDIGPSLRPLQPRLTFAGGVMGYNWHRALWLGAATHKGLPVDRQLSTHQPDGLPVLDSYANYLRRLMDATISLNFSMRNDFSRITTSRTFEATLSGALLVEEWSSDIDYYFVAGEHYLSFTRFSELSAIARFIDTNREEVEAIRRNGFEFARKHYSDANILAGLDHLLYRADPRQAALPSVSTTDAIILRLPLTQKQPAEGAMRMPAEITHPAQATVMQYMNDGVPVITVGRYSYINKMNTITVDNRSRIVIGHFTSIAWDVLFLLRSNHHPEWVTTYPVDWFPWDESKPRPNDPHGKNKDNISVGSDVWIGKGVTIMPGVTIGDGAIIAADAVVSKDVRPYAIVAGNPGREIRRRFDEETIEYLMKAKWWDQPDEFIMKHCDVICSGNFERLKQILPVDVG